MWDPVHTQGPSDWHLALFLRPCFHLGGTWTSRIPSWALALPLVGSPDPRSSNDPPALRPLVAPDSRARNKRRRLAGYGGCVGARSGSEPPLPTTLFPSHPSESRRGECKLGGGREWDPENVQTSGARELRSWASCGGGEERRTVPGANRWWDAPSKEGGGCPGGQVRRIAATQDDSRITLDRGSSGKGMTVLS